MAKQRDGTLMIAGRPLRCGNNRNVLDPHLPNLGLAAPGVVVFNPRLLNRWSDTVRLFVFTHECGHISVGDSELDADCYAVNRGVKDGWLDRKGLAQVCDSFEGAPETDTHPSAKRRCVNLDRCFARAEAEMTPIAPKPIPARLPARLPPVETAAVPALPVAKSTALGQQKVISAWRCTDPLPITTGSIDPIGQVIKKDAEHSERCR